jgi:hypothetical protein
LVITWPDVAVCRLLSFWMLITRKDKTRPMDINIHLQKLSQPWKLNLKSVPPLDCLSRLMMSNIICSSIGINGRIILKWILHNWDGGDCQLDSYGSPKEPCDGLFRTR